MSDPIPLHPLSTKEENARLRDLLHMREREINRLREENTRLQRLAYEDPLTGVGNKRFFLDELERLKQVTDRYCIAVIDIDHFKRINDENGHALGDKALKKLGFILKAEEREGDIVARVGGEEFAVVLRHCDAAGAKIYLNRLFATIRNDLVLKNHTDQLLRVTVSAGFAESRRGEDPEALLRRADEALYAAKGRGRDCVSW